MSKHAAMPAQLLSLPVWGAWIEIFLALQGFFSRAGRSPCGERGLKYRRPAALGAGARRSPCGERGLKSVKILRVRMLKLVAPRVGSVD